MSVFVDSDAYHDLDVGKKSYLFILLKINKVNSLKKEQLFIKI